jgi:hypothetical protein
MPTITVYSDLPPEEIVQLVKDIVEDCSNPTIEDDLWKHFRVALFTPIAAAYEIKANHGTDRLGNRWTPLSAARLENKIVNKDKILIETGRLQAAVKTLASFHGIDQVVAFGYPNGNRPRYTNEEQVRIEHHPDSITCAVTVPYAHFQDTDQWFDYRGKLVFKPARPLWPDKLKVWFDRAVVKFTKLLSLKIASEFSSQAKHEFNQRNVPLKPTHSHENASSLPF